jgi:hypothetical protein
MKATYVISRPSDINSKLPVLVVKDNEILELETLTEAEDLVKILKSNDSLDREYTIRKIG